jgi:hypothetical protein
MLVFWVVTPCVLSTSKHGITNHKTDIDNFFAGKAYVADNRCHVAIV